MVGAEITTVLPGSIEEFDRGTNIHSAPGTFTTLPETLPAIPPNTQVRVIASMHDAMFVAR